MANYPLLFINMIKAVFLDISGVITVGDSPIDGAVEAVQQIQQLGLELRFLTNTSRQTRKALLEGLQSHGFECAEQQIYTAPFAAHDWMQQQGKRPYCLVHPNILSEFEDLDQQDPNAVIIGDAADDLNYANLNRAFRLCQQGAPLVGIGRNRYFKLGDDFLLDAGPFIAAIEYAANTEAIIMGKPSIEFFEQVMASVSCDSSEVLMVGDDVFGDIEGALNAGLQACLVRTGKYQAADENRIEGQFVVKPSIVEVVDDLRHNLAAV